MLTEFQRNTHWRMGWRL